MPKEVVPSWPATPAMPARLQGRGLPQGFAAGKIVSKEPFVILWPVALGPCREPVAWDVAGGSSSPFRPATFCSTA